MNNKYIRKVIFHNTIMYSIVWEVELIGITNICEAYSDNKKYIFTEAMLCIDEYC